MHALQLVHDRPSSQACRPAHTVAEEADILEGDRDARSFEAVALERAQELIVLAGVFRLTVARVEPKGLCCAGDVVQLQADSLRFD